MHEFVVFCCGSDLHLNQLGRVSGSGLSGFLAFWLSGFLAGSWMDGHWGRICPAVGGGHFERASEFAEGGSTQALGPKSSEDRQIASQYKQVPFNV